MYQPRVSIFPKLSQTQRKLSVLGGALVTSAAVGIPMLFRKWTQKSVDNGQMAAEAAPSENAAQNIYITRTVTVNRPIEDVYHFWHNLSNLPQVMDYVESVYAIGNTLTHWTLKFPGDLKAEFDAETYIDIPNTMISWRSLPESELQSAGSVRLQPAEGGTEIHFTLEFVPPGGAVGAAILKIVTESYVDHALHDYKRSMEETSVEVEAHGGL